MLKLLGFVLLLAAATLPCVAGDVPAPEVDPASGGAAIALLAGGLLILRARRKKQ